METLTLSNLVASYTNLVPAFMLVLFRVSGLMLFSPLFGSSRIPRRVKLLLSIGMTVGCMGVGSIDVQIPETIEWLIVACGLELLFGLAIGMCASAVFIAAQWAGELIGQQVGFNISEAFDPQFSGGSTLVSEVYFLLTLCVFLIVGGHRTMVEGVHQSLLHLPPALLSVEPRLGDLVLSTADAAATVALRLAMPVFLSMLIVDFTIGAIGRSMPQLNVMTAGLSIRAALGLLIVGLSAFVTADVLEQAVLSGLATMSQAIGV